MFREFQYTGWLSVLEVFRECQYTGWLSGVGVFRECQYTGWLSGLGVSGDCQYTGWLSGLGEFPDRWREDLLVTWLAAIAACHTAKQPLCTLKTIPTGLSVIRL